MNFTEKMPLFSIIIATYNRAGFLSKAITSVLDQTYQDWELIIVDDGSTDNTSAIIRPFLKDKRVRYIWQPNQERSIARNNGISASFGEYICFLDSDDYYLPHHLTTFYQYISNNRTELQEILTVNRSYKNGENEKIICFNPIKFSSKNEEILFRAILDSPPIQCICIHRAFFNNVKFSNEWLPFAECNQFSYELMSAGYNYRFISTHSVVMLHHATNTTTYTYPFIFLKMKFIETYSKKLNLFHHPATVESRINAHLGLADTSSKPKEVFCQLIKAFTLKPAILMQRQTYGIIKKNLLKKLG